MMGDFSPHSTKASRITFTSQPSKLMGIRRIDDKCFFRFSLLSLVRVAFARLSEYLVAAWLIRTQQTISVKVWREVGPRPIVLPEEDPWSLVNRTGLLDI